MALNWEIIAEQAARWIRSQVERAGSEGVVVGLSGGIDSSVVAALAQHALGPNMLGVLMPCNSDPQDAEHARLLADAFGIETVEIDLAAAWEGFKRSLPAGSGLANANLKPRLRMTALFYVANSRGYLVAGTGNKTEFMIGYFTKYGDGGVDIMPLAGLYKFEVRELARELGVPAPIIEKPPSAGLWDGQTDEGEIGMTYAELDAILQALERRDEPDATAEKVEKVRRLVAASEHKRNLAPIFSPSTQSRPRS